MDKKLNRLVIAQTAITCQKLLKLVDPRYDKVTKSYVK